MAVLDPERAQPRSALRYRPLNSHQGRPEPPVSRARRSRSDARVTATPVAPADRDLEEQAPRRRVGVPPLSTHTRRRVHPLLLIGLGLIIMIVLLVGLIEVMNWGTNELNTLKYGNPRTYQIDAVVGQGDSPQHPSHFIAVNLSGTVTILEFPAGDPSHARVLASTTIMGPDAGQAVVTLRFIDINHNGHPDMLIDVGGIQSVLVNDQGTFRPPTAAEQQQILKVLQ